MSIEQMREAVVNAYPGDTWKNRVRHMPEKQILAIYNRIYLDAIKKPCTSKINDGVQLRMNI